MELGLKDKVVVITGGSAGIGECCVEEFLKEGCYVAICGRNIEKLQKITAKYQKYFDRLAVYQADVSIPEQLRSFFDFVEEKFSVIHVLYNNAGIGIRKPLLTMSLEEWDKVINTNLRSVFVASTYVVSKMKEGGIIINASSFDMRIPLAGNGPYSASKWGVEALTRIMAAEFAPYKIRVVSIAPSMVETDLTRKRIEENEDFFARQTVLKRVAKPIDIASAILLLCSDQASYITGTTIEISGGKYCVQNPQFGWEAKGVL